MITLQEIFNHLTYGELAQVAIGGGANGFIADQDYPKAISFVNRALTALHQKFLLAKEKLLLQQYVGTNIYYLRSDYAVSNADSLLIPKYIVDSVAIPFEDNLFKVEQVFSAEGTEYPLNDASAEVPIFTTKFDVLEMVPVIPELLTVAYRSGHKKIVYTLGFDPASVQLHIPNFILEALLLHIAARVFAPIGNGEGETNLHRIFAANYELECQKLEQQNLDLESDTRSLNSAFSRGGWI